MSDCRHLHGAWIADIGLWVCGQCFGKLESRPVRYGMLTGPSGSGPRQQIIWQAEVKVSAEGTTLADFLRTMSRNLERCCPTFNRYDAYSHAIDLLKGEDEFADPAYDWSHASARERVNEDMQYWEPEPEAEGNEE